MTLRNRLTAADLRHVHAAALLVLLPAAAGARVIPADLVSFADDRLDRPALFAAALGMRLLLLRIANADRLHIFRHAIAAGVFVRRGRDMVRAASLGLTDHAGAEDQVAHLLAHVHHHLFKEAEPFLLVQH